MTKDPENVALVDVLLALLRRQTITAPDADAGIDILVTKAGILAASDDWRAAVSSALVAGYIYEPTTLSIGAVHCYWHLQLTPRGFEVATKS